MTGYYNFLLPMFPGRCLWDYSPFGCKPLYWGIYFIHLQNILISWRWRQQAPQERR